MFSFLLQARSGIVNSLVYKKKFEKLIAALAVTSIKKKEQIGYWIVFTFNNENSLYLPLN